MNRLKFPKVELHIKHNMYYTQSTMTILQDKHTCIRYKFNISSHLLMIDHYIQWFIYKTYTFNVFEKFLICELEVKNHCQSLTKWSSYTEENINYTNVASLKFKMNMFA
jgi:hypothetical protein